MSLHNISWRLSIPREQDGARHVTARIFSQQAGVGAEVPSMRLSGLGQVGSDSRLRCPAEPPQSSRSAVLSPFRRTSPTPAQLRRPQTCLARPSSGRSLQMCPEAGLAGVFRLEVGEPGVVVDMALPVGDVSGKPCALADGASGVAVAFGARGFEREHHQLAPDERRR